ncbi:MAG TPA: hypothetical protein VHG51_12590, partial [Longimicrobiaceae bacterium]|nr:hypothetical protein [Longimicrobiaceae bacterium]
MLRVLPTTLLLRRTSQLNRAVFQARCRCIAWVHLLAASVSGCAGTSSRPGPQSSVGGEQQGHASACTVTEISREQLTTEDGREVYVEPNAIAASPHGGLLLAGVPNYVWSRADGELTAVARDSVLGALVSLEGRARLIPAPIDPGLVGPGIRALAQEDGTWAVVFAELVRGTRSPGEEETRNLWFGVFDGEKWSRLERLPVPTEGRPQSFPPSALVGRGDTLALAVKLDVTPGQSNVALFTRRDGRWAYEIVPMPHALYVQLSHSDALGFLLAAVHGRTRSKDETPLSIWAKAPTWRAIRRVASAEHEELHEPSIIQT